MKSKDGIIFFSTGKNYACCQNKIKHSNFKLLSEIVGANGGCVR